MICSAQRRDKILALTNLQGKVSVIELAEKFSISQVTIRQDLNALNKMGLVVRSHGGALANSQLSPELSIGQKKNSHQVTKKKLAAYAATLINNGDSIILDSGTTTQEIAACLANHQDLTVMTNGINVALALTSNSDIEVFTTGGSLRNKSLSCSNEQAINSLKHLHFDKVILGVDGLDLHAGITTHFEPEASLNRMMCANSSQIIAVTDSSKLGNRSCHVICHYREIHTLVTDSGIKSQYIDALRDAGVEVCIVQ